MSYSERAYAGPDMWGNTYVPDHCHHCAARDDFLRLERIRKDARAAIDRRRGGRGFRR